MRSGTSVCDGGGTFDRRSARWTETAACALAACLALAGAATAQDEDDEELDEILVTAMRADTPAEEAAGSVTVVTAKDIEDGQKRTVADVLRDVPAVDIVQSGGAGQLSEVLIRGADPKHTLVLVDGIEINDPMWMGRGYNFAHLGTENIEQIEILRGPQSLLYGSDATGGVVNIVTKTGRDAVGSYASLEGGSFGTLRAVAGGGGELGAASFAVSVSRTRVEGISAAGEDYGNTEPDGYENTSLSGKLSFKPDEGRKVDVILRYIDARTDMDDGGGTGGDDPNREKTSRQVIAGVQTYLGEAYARWRQKVGVSLVSHATKDNDDSDPVDVGELKRDTFDGRSLKFDWQNNVRLAEANSLVFGIEVEREDGISTGFSTLDADAHLAGFYVRDEIRLAEGASVTFGGRVDDHSMFGTEATWKATASHLFPPGATRVKATVGTGFKAPSLFQLYSSYGDPGLQAEESLGWDVGIEQRFADGAASAGVTYFRNDFENLIVWDVTKYANIGEARTQGAEVVAAYRPSPELEMGASYTYTDAVDETSGAPLVRRPEHKAGLNVRWRLAERGALGLDVTYAGEREDFTTTLEAYTLVGLSASFDVSEKVRVFARIENLLDEDYEYAAGYGTPGASVIVGARAAF